VSPQKRISKLRPDREDEVLRITSMVTNVMRQRAETAAGLTPVRPSRGSPMVDFASTIRRDSGGQHQQILKKL